MIEEKKYDEMQHLDDQYELAKESYMKAVEEGNHKKSSRAMRLLHNLSKRGHVKSTLCIAHYKSIENASL